MNAAEKQMAAIDAAGGDITKVPLSRAEEARLRHQEEVVEQGLATFVEVGNALAAIRDGKLYRATHSTFEAYCKDRWGLGDRHARNIINAAEVGTMVPVANERQAREMVGLEPDEAREVFQKAMAETAGRPTAKSFREARDDIAPRPGSKVRRRPLPEAFRTKSWEAYKLTKSLANLVEDDRWTSNVSSCQGSAFEVRQAIEALAKVTRALGLGELVLVDNPLVAAALKDDVQEPDIDTALAAVRAEGDLSAENVVSKLAKTTSSCTVCAGELDPVIVAEGHVTHPGCEVAS